MAGVEEPLVLRRRQGDTVHLTLNRPERHNSLVPELLEALVEAVEEATADTACRAVVLGAAGRSFSTGGDLAAFQAHADRIAEYSQTLVGLLNRAILGLTQLDVPLIGRVQGPVTGGALGLVLACDLVAITPATFFAPYYVDVGFSPDGGWTALLPGRIGAHRSREIQLLNRRVESEEAVALGLAECVVDEPRLDERINAWLTTLSQKNPHSIRETKRRIHGAEPHQRLALELEDERRRFVERIRQPDALQCAARFQARTSQRGAR